MRIKTRLQKFIILFLISTLTIVILTAFSHDKQVGEINLENIEVFDEDGILIGYLVPFVKQTFFDVDENYWAFNEIEFLSNKGIINGFSDQTFRPNQGVTKTQAVLMILREKGITDFSNIKDPGYADVNQNTFGYKEIAKATELGIISGYEKNGKKYFDPNGTLTRSQMAKMLAKANDLKGKSDIEFKDVSKNHWAYEDIQALAYHGIVKGYENGNYGVNDVLTRGQFAVMMTRLIELKEN